MHRTTASGDAEAVSGHRPGMAPDPFQIVRTRGGVTSTRSMRNAGVPRRAIERAVKTGRLQRVREGVYCDPSLPPEVVHALRHGGRLACSSAAQARGLWVLDDLRLHLAMKPGRHEHPDDHCRPVVHWNADEKVSLNP